MLLLTAPSRFEFVKSLRFLESVFSRGKSWWLTWVCIGGNNRCRRSCVAVDKWGERFRLFLVEAGTISSIHSLLAECFRDMWVGRGEDIPFVALILGNIQSETGATPRCCFFKVRWVDLARWIDSFLGRWGILI